MRVLIVSPHPDDAELALGGMIARMVQDEEHTVDIAVVVGPGDLTMVHSGVTVPFSQRVAEQMHAADILGVSKIHWMNIGRAPYLDTIPLVEGVVQLDKLLSENMYDQMFIPLPSHNQDHRYTWDMCMAATRPSKCDSTAISAYEQPTQYHSEQLVFSVQCRKYIKLDETHVRLKQAALHAFNSQMGGRYDSIAGIGGAMTLLTLRGLECGEKYAEMVYPIRQVI